MQVFWIVSVPWEVIQSLHLHRPCSIPRPSTKVNLFPEWWRRPAMFHCHLIGTSCISFCLSWLSFVRYNSYKVSRFICNSHGKCWILWFSLLHCIVLDIRTKPRNLDFQYTIHYDITRSQSYEIHGSILELTAFIQSPTYPVCAVLP